MGFFRITSMSMSVRRVRQVFKKQESIRDDKNGKGDRKCFRCGDPNHLIIECPKPLKDKNQRAFVEGSWSDSGEKDDEKVKDETCLVPQASNEVKENQEKDKIESKSDKNGKRGKAKKSLKQLQWIKEEKLSKTQKEWLKTHTRLVPTKSISYYQDFNVKSLFREIVKENQEKDKIGSEKDKNGKRVKAGKSLKQLQLIKEEKPKKTQKEWSKTHTRSKSYSNFKRKKKRKGPEM
nr:alpha/beta hydrolases superfamily protein [Tanacetum cinerariifolium]